MPLTRLLLSALILILLLGACAGRKTTPADTAGDTAPTSTTQSSSASDNGVGPAAQPEAAPVSAGPRGGLLDQRVFLFDFDKSDVRAQDLDAVNAHARYLAANPQQKARLEGHTDARGTREYNIGLGERRGQAVRRLLMLQGAADNQVQTVSFGEERPAVEGDEESAFEQNRRVEIVYSP
jgi:peptidoglycan-associated lipoprotein